MLAKLRARQQHQQLMRAAHHLLREAFLGTRDRTVTPNDLAAYAFGRYRIALDTNDAQDFLNAARASRGEPLTPAA
ncbi:hypothetical protein ACFW9D_05475 [Streptomyces sp. NPDC059524]|uniref:hypothetical protein n=1 Tax=Streptomyces sp. NPDC059524 TaxID=3346856 RepID=UPI0036AEE13D